MTSMRYSLPASTQRSPSFSVLKYHFCPAPSLVLPGSPRSPPSLRPSIHSSNHTTYKTFAPISISSIYPILSPSESHLPNSASLVVELCSTLCQRYLKSSGRTSLTTVWRDLSFTRAVPFPFPISVLHLTRTCTVSRDPPCSIARWLAGAQPASFFRRRISGALIMNILDPSVRLDSVLVSR